MTRAEIETMKHENANNCGYWVTINSSKLLPAIRQELVYDPAVHLQSLCFCLSLCNQYLCHNF